MMRPALRVFLLLVQLAALATLAWGVRTFDDAAPFPLTQIAFWLTLSFAAELFWFDTQGAQGMVSMSSAVNLATVFVLPPLAAFVIVALSVLLSDLLLHRRPVVRASFNAAQSVVSLGVAYLLLFTLSGIEAPPGSRAVLEHPIAVWAAPIGFYFVNTFLVAGAIDLSGQSSVWRAWMANYGASWFLLTSLVLFILAVTLVSCVEALGLWSGVAFILLYLMVKEGSVRLASD